MLEKLNKLNEKNISKNFIAKTDKEINDLINKINELDNYKYGIILKINKLKKKSKFFLFLIK